MARDCPLQLHLSENEQGRLINHNDLWLSRKPQNESSQTYRAESDAA